MRLAAALAALAVAAACGPTSVRVAIAPAFQRVQVEQMAFRADDLERAAMSGAGGVGLRAGFRGAALATLEAMSERLSQRGMHIEERDIARKLVFFDPRALEAVLAITARRRLVTPDDVGPAWVVTARQWWLRFAYESGAWWVVGQQDLPPDRWFATS